ncbi:MAG: hypothetical protein QOG31_623 [Thermoplasmata archaeon]|jgi:CheY-like chemotaxis protein|nr:hypothetical protein [Thermoplasmata archaeon]
MPLILWAEDNAQDRILIREALDGVRGPTLEFAHDGVALLEALAQRRPDLVVLDLRMPRMGGLEALRRIRESAEWRSLPAIVFSSGNQVDEVGRCRALGVADVVQKPVDFDAFSAAVRAIIAVAGPG